MATLNLNFQSLALKLDKKHTNSFSLRINASIGGGKSGKQLIESGIVRAIPPKEAAIALKSDGLKLLDVRPEWEREKARVSGSLHVPLFIKDTDNSLITLLKKWVHLGYIGLWTGQKFTTINSEFVSQVQRIVPDKDAMLLVACGEGLRSIVAVSKLHEVGYKNLGWLAGGFTRAKDGDFLVEGDEKLQYATIGGVSYYFLKLLTLLQAADTAN
ncbi:rhodanese-like domain-containing protein 10 [Chenopodium quinoa]|uniref:Rhodanese domain-containing protein n=1 Tax=Chenopodium quinoa TaxID=63459 RepID=A0A803LTW4_CHEQI|nr:rhodanese-like domain-containing protein 10 [Chenopodium quinoa]